MPHIEREIIINRPVEEVFDFIADVRNEPQYNSHLLRAEQLSPGPIGLGTQFRSAGKMIGPITVQITSEITAYERSQRMCTSGATVIGVLPIMRVQGTETFDSIAAGTRVWWSLQLEPCGVFKLMAPQLVRELGQRLDTAFATLKRLLETQQVPQEDGRVGVASDIS